MEHRAFMAGQQRRAIHSDLQMLHQNQSVLREHCQMLFAFIFYGLLHRLNSFIDLHNVCVSMFGTRDTIFAWYCIKIALRNELCAQTNYCAVTPKNCVNACPQLVGHYSMWKRSEEEQFCSSHLNFVVLSVVITFHTISENRSESNIRL